MAALTKDRETIAKDFHFKWYPVAGNTKIYKGSIVALTTTGYARPAADVASLRVVGVALEQVDNTGADGAKKIRVESGRAHKFAASSITQAMVGDVMYVVDDQTFDDALGTNGIKAGRLVEFVSATEGWILIQPVGQGITNADAGATYTAAEQALINALKANLNIDVLS